MTFIARGEVYDGYPMGADCDLDALILGVAVPNMVVDSLVALAHMLGVPVLRSDVERQILPAAAGLGGAGSLAPVSGLPTAPGAPNETRKP
ncbi:hypothetical protein ACFULT_26580 [Rhodococcus sp. NPDC057297]|uniref:hypothetical protein n=1 Tax=Rhodococcus sp. NPDC057297 TaxID=3346090 RepID=UPI00362BEC32